MPMLTKPCPQMSSSFPNIKHATFTTRDAVDEKEGAREMVLDMTLKFNYLYVIWHALYLGNWTTFENKVTIIGVLSLVMCQPTFCQEF